MERNKINRNKNINSEDRIGEVQDNKEDIIERKEEILEEEATEENYKETY